MTRSRPRDDRTGSPAWRSACRQKADHPGHRCVMRRVTLADDTPRRAFARHNKLR
jgi:hypothetical protein